MKLNHYEERLASASASANDPFDEVDQDSSDVLVLEPEKTKAKPPPLYRVVMFNDDYTPMEFVVHVLMEFFGMDHDKAERVMLTIHTVGQAVVGIYPRDVAETKCDQVNKYSQSMQYPLLSQVEKTE